MQNQAVQLQGSQSTFVNVLAWIFIVMSGFATFIALLQNVMINTMFPLDQMRSQSEAVQKMPALFQFMMAHIQLFFLAFLLLSSGTFAAAIGLLRRRNWARLAIVGILSLGILWNIVGLAIQQVMISSMSTFPANAPQDFHAEFDRIATVIRFFSAFMAVGMSALFAWLIKRLLSESIRAEFMHAP